jgi:hypothetical protein
MQLPHTYLAASQKMAADLKTIAVSPQIVQLSRLSLPEIERLSDEIARIVPAGNVPGLILSGLTRLEGREVSPVEHQQNLALLFRGVRDLVDKAVYGAVFAGPAAIIMAYQNLLELAGKDVGSAFPDGTWQFYLEFALREDSARHANETTGFHGKLAAHGIGLDAADTLTAWVMASIVTLHTYPLLLENEWRERVYPVLLNQAAEQAGMEQAVSVLNSCAGWDKQRPFARGRDADNDDYPTYRRHKFDAFISDIVAMLPAPVQASFAALVRQAEREELPAYLAQMSILARLEPSANREKRVPYALGDAQIAIVYGGRYVMLSVADGSGQNFPNVHVIRSQMIDLLCQPPLDDTAADFDLLLAGTRREAQAALRGRLPKDEQKALAAFAHVPIILNANPQTAHFPLAAIRQGRRGIGDHALTLFFTEDSTVFDQSHIFFDGAWGAALAEIMTNEAISWALYLAQTARPAPTNTALPHIRLVASKDTRRALERTALAPEAWAESAALRLSAVHTLRRLFKSRSDLVIVTVNDLLVLYRTVHGQRYQPSAKLVASLEPLAMNDTSAGREAYAAIMAAVDKAQRGNPALMIPMDASQHAPKERIYPTTFRNPLGDLLSEHASTLEVLRAYQSGQGNRGALYTAFDEQQRAYLRTLASFGVLMRRYKEIALSGQSTSTMSIKMMAHMPEALQRLLDQIPGRFDVLNEIIKGEEVFSNVGRVAKGSTLRRFITAKDDNPQKTLAWGIVTDDQDIVRITLRDFRPHVKLLAELDMLSLAHQIAQDFLDSYVEGFNLFVRELREITVASRETKSQRTRLHRSEDA